MLLFLTRDTLSSDKTVALAIISRYLRRLTAHTANIASSVTNPIEWLDYKSKKPV
jgi:phosphate uptake regulator